MLGITKDSNNVYIIFNSISLSAFLTLIVGFILSICLILYMPNNIRTSFIILLSTLVIAYEINCLEVGKCDNVAWTLTMIYLFFSSITLYFIFKHKNDPIGLKNEIKTWFNKIGIDLF